MNDLERFLKIQSKIFAEKIDTLTKEQFERCLNQAVECGDFMAHVTPTNKIESTDKHKYTVTHAQSVTYEPYRKCRELNDEIGRLKGDIIRLQHKFGVEEKLSGQQT